MFTKKYTLSSGFNKKYNSAPTTNKTFFPPSYHYNIFATHGEDTSFSNLDKIYSEKTNKIMSILCDKDNTSTKECSNFMKYAIQMSKDTNAYRNFLKMIPHGINLKKVEQLMYYDFFDEDVLKDPAISARLVTIASYYIQVGKIEGLNLMFKKGICRFDHYSDTIMIYLADKDISFIGRDDKQKDIFTENIARLTELIVLFFKNLNENNINKKFLEKYPFLLNIRTRNGQTALHLVVQNNDWDTCKILIESGIDCNVTDNLEKTALHYAAEPGLEDIFIHLIENTNINPDLKDFVGLTAIDYARKLGGQKILDFLNSKKLIYTDEVFYKDKEILQSNSCPNSWRWNVSSKNKKDDLDLGYLNESLEL